MLRDKYGRLINYLRLSITDLCNLNCIYCGQGRKVKKRERSWILNYEEVYRIAHLMTRLGIIHIRITGGEPLVRKGVVDFIRRLAKIEGVIISMTTNGLLLKEYAADLYQGGLKKLNVSLDSLDEERYRYITQGGSLKETLAGIDKAQRVGFKEIEINVVPLSNINDDQLMDFVNFGIQYGLNIRFIELMPMTDWRFDWKKAFVPTPKIKEKLGSLDLIPVNGHQGSGPAEYFQIRGTKRLIGFISPVSNRFCYRCNRIRLTANGRLRPCLGSNLEIDLKRPIRSGATDEELSGLICEAVKSKPEGHRMDVKNLVERGMRALGG